MRKVIDARLFKAVRKIARELSDRLIANKTGPYDPDARRIATDAAVFAIEALGGVIRDDANVFALTLGGVRSTSTSGILGAMTNWLRAAEPKIGGAA